MSSNQRGPVYFFVALIGLAFMCICLVAVGFGATRMAGQFNWPGSENSASLAFGRDYWKEGVLRNIRLTRNSGATTSPPPPSP